MFTGTNLKYSAIDSGMKMVFLMILGGWWLGGRGGKKIFLIGEANLQAILPY